MPFVLTLVSSDKPLSAGHLAEVEGYVDTQGLYPIGEPDWLHAHKAADIPVSDCLNPVQMRELRGLLKEDRVDVFCTPSRDRRKKLLLADMDSTIVTTETLDELALHVEGTIPGIGEKIASITARAMNGELDFRTALKERIRFLKGVSAALLETTLQATQISPGAETLVRTMRQNGAVCVLVSGGFTFFTGAIAGRLGFSQHHGNSLEIADGALTGKVGEPILDRNAKLAFLREYTKDLGLSFSDTAAVGDGANDLPMLETAALGLGYRPKPVLDHALRNSIHFADLTAMLYVQGYRESEIAF